MTAIPARSARRLFMAAQGLFDDPARRATIPSLAKLVRELGYVQIDTIQVIERAHHLILAARLDGYRHDQLARLTEEKRALFEGWTHDASLIPTEFFPHWKLRFLAIEEWMLARPRFQARLGSNPQRAIQRVYDRVAKEGPLMASDFEHDHKSRGWWDHKPPKVALNFLWQTGRLSISARRNFAKVYDLMERTYPAAHALAGPPLEETLDWLCAAAMQRLQIATPAELAGFWGWLPLPVARKWCAKAEADGRVVAARVASANGAETWSAYAVRDWRRRAGALAPPPDRMRLLSPFDPLVRDRRRLKRLFGFDYRFEAFVPPAKRTHGYYVMPVLEGDRLVARLDPKLHRQTGRLEIKGLWWEEHARPTPRRRRGLVQAIERLADFVGAGEIDLRGAP